MKQKTIKPSSDYDWGEFTFDDLPKLGKVVAKFRLERVHNFFQMPPDKEWVLKASCLSEERLREYIGNSPWYGWEIKNLVIFDEPMELEQFDYPNPSGIRNVSQCSIKGLPNKKRAPESWCYVEVKETTKHESY